MAARVLAVRDNGRSRDFKPEALYTFKAAAHHLGLHPTTLRRMVQEGRIRVTRISDGRQGRRISGQEILRVGNTQHQPS